MPNSTGHETLKTIHQKMTAVDLQLLELLETRWTLMKSLHQPHHDLPVRLDVRTKEHLLSMYHKGKDLPVEILVTLLAELEAQLVKHLTFD